MQMRFDGFVGFPGGFIDSTDESIVDGLNRELVEEINFDTDKHRVTQNDHVMSCVCSHKKLVTHFYAINVTYTQYEDMERRVLAAHDWGSEVGSLQKWIFFCYFSSVFWSNKHMYFTNKSMFALKTLLYKALPVMYGN